MSKITATQKNKLLRKLKNANIVNEKDILNIKVSDLKKIKEASNLAMVDIEIIWLIQEAIDKKNLLDFFTES